jgi:hypothetical protein
MSKRFSLAKAEAAENLDRWNTSRIWRGRGGVPRHVIDITNKMV